MWRLENGVLWKRGDADLKYVPLGLRREVIDLYHGSDFNMHAGRDSTLQDLKSRFYWPCMDRDVSLFVQHCLWCRKAKSILPTKAGLFLFKV